MRFVMWDSEDFLGRRTQGSAVQVDLITFCRIAQESVINSTNQITSHICSKTGEDNRFL